MYNMSFLWVRVARLYLLKLHSVQLQISEEWNALKLALIIVIQFTLFSFQSHLHESISLFHTTDEKERSIEKIVQR